MSAVEQAVARSRLAGGAAQERKTFTLARKRAIRKMRQFALADPYYYVLELVQAAVAQGASYVKIELGDGSFRLSSTGACFREEELGQLFDFLFAGKDRADLGHVRELALGVNALLLFEPTTVTVESGDGTLEGSTRLVLSHGAEQVEVGRAPSPLTGTTIKAEGLHRKALSKKSALMELPGLPMEASALEERCLTAPVPIVVNDRPLFGYSAARLPRLPGYARSLTIDEEDLYGCIGLGPQGFPASFKLLTFGVWIESVERGADLGGILCFDRLHKTADHSGIVQDHVWEELWARIRPYAERLQTGDTRTVDGSVSLLGGRSLPMRELRPLLQASGRVCLVPLGTFLSSPEGRAAKSIGEALEAPVLCVKQADHSWLKALAGPGTAFLALDLSGDADLTFFTQSPRLEPPVRPWLTGEITLPSFPMDELIEALRGRLEAKDQLLALFALRGLGEVRARVYTPAEPPTLTGLTVRLCTVDRIFRKWNLASAFPGQVLDVVLPDLQPRALNAAIPVGPGATRSLGTLLAWEVSERAAPALAEAARRALARPQASQDTSPMGRTLALAALERSLVTRLTAGKDGRPLLRLSLMGQGLSEDLLSFPLFASLDGSPVSLSQLAESMATSHGLVYGALPEVPPSLDGLDTRGILALDVETERRLLTLVGDSAYVRVDQREVLAQHRGVCCRDLALGLRAYPDFPLLVEGADPTAWPEGERAALLAVLLDQLERCVAGGPREAAPGQAPGPPPGEEERRQACRHLQWFVCQRALVDPAGERIPGFGVEELPLFLDPEDRAWSFSEVRRALVRPEGLTVTLHRALGSSELGLLVAAMCGPAAQADQAPQSLSASPFVAALLAPLGGVRFALDHPLPHEAPDTPDPPEQPSGTSGALFLCRAEVIGEGFAGQVGIPMDLLARPAVAVLVKATDRLHALPEVALRFGMVGLVRLDAPAPLDEEVADRLDAALGAAGERLLEELIGLLPTLPAEAPAHVSAALRLLSFAADHLQILASPDGSLRFSTHHRLAPRALALPLFPGAGGGLLTGSALVERFCRQGGEALSPSLLDPRAPTALWAWVGRYLNPARVIRPALTRAPLAPMPPAATDHPEDAPLAATVQRLLHALRPDLDEGEPSGSAGPLWRGHFRVVARRRAIFSRFTNPGELLVYTTVERTPTLVLNADHWLFAHARARAATDPTALAALLLGCFAHANAALDPITNAHEQIFQRRIIEALERETLGLDPPATPGPQEITP